MLSEYKTKTNIGVGLGLIGQIIGRTMMNTTHPGQAMLGLIVALASLVLFIWGCAMYAKGKGHSGWFGLLGLLSIIGLIILVVLPDRHKTAGA